MALKVYPKVPSFVDTLEQLNELDRSDAGRSIPPQYALRGGKVKAYQDENRYFAMNILRFFAEKKYASAAAAKKFCDVSLEIDFQLRNEPIQLAAKAILVISDAYLSNPSPKAGCD